jgi:hypothetical protein
MINPGHRAGIFCLLNLYPPQGHIDFYSLNSISLINENKKYRFDEQ